MQCHPTFLTLSLFFFTHFHTLKRWKVDYIVNVVALNGVFKVVELSVKGTELQTSVDTDTVVWSCCE